MLLSIGLALALTACGGGARPDTGTTTPPAASTTPAPAPPRAVTIPAGDASLTGRVYGSGSTAVVLSNMGDNDPAPWDAFAPVLAARGYTVLVYSYRYPRLTPDFTAAMAAGTVADLRAAIALVRREGATRLVLIGASLGGMATAKVAGSARPAAVVVMASPLDLAEADFRITPRELAAMTSPKLVVASDADTSVPYAATRELYDRAPEPVAAERETRRAAAETAPARSMLHITQRGQPPSVE